MQLSDFYKLAKIYNLSKEEADLIILYAKKAKLDPQRILVNKLLLKKLLQRYQQESLNPNPKLIKSIQNKLGALSLLDSLYTKSNDIPIGSEGKFYIDQQTFTPIYLEKNQSDYLLWRLISHRNMELPTSGLEGFIILNDQYKRTYRFKTKIKDILQYKDITQIRTLHSNNLELLTTRNHPRVKTECAVSIKKEKELFRGTMCNISEGGAKIHIEHASHRLFKNNRLKLNFTLDSHKINTKAKVIYTEQKDFYGVIFEDLPLHNLYLIQNYIKKNLDKVL